MTPHGLPAARCRAEPPNREDGGDAPGSNGIAHGTEFRPTSMSSVLTQLSWRCSMPVRGQNAKGPALPQVLIRCTSTPTRLHIGQSRIPKRHF
jgi:hypothetical protein